MTAHMTYYETPAGAKVFSAGAFTLAGSVRQPAVQRLLANLWERLADERTVSRNPASAGRVDAGYGWPVKPFRRQHPVRGYFGDPRIGMTPTGMRRSFHFGIDISAPDATAVYATISGTVQRWGHRPDVVGVRADDGPASHEYWHITPSVSAGERVTAYRTVVGHIGKGWGHVHFSELRDGRYLNPLRRAALSPYEDDTRPLVKSLRAESGGEGVPQSRLAGTVGLVVEAIDSTPLAVPAPWTNRPVTPALIRWRVRGGPWQTAVDVRLHLPGDDRYDTVFALWTRQNKPWSNGRYRLYLTRGWNTAALVDGPCRIDVAASDSRGNTTLTSFDVRIRNGVGRD
jgi:hypothetical protein